MGVSGLWQLVDSAGKVVPLETLEGKVLAVDVSIWIHQVLQGYQDRHGNPKPNAHLLGLFHRICKLLYYKVKPVFVFDGGVPMLKKNTIAARRKQKSIASCKAQKMKADLINNLIKHSAVKTILDTDTDSDKRNLPEVATNLLSQRKEVAIDIFKLPSLPSTSQEQFEESDEYDSDSSIQLSPRKQTKWMGNIHSVDVASAEFKSLPPDVRYDILTDLKETRKQNSWGRLHEMPEETHEFSGFQMKRLLKRRLVQESLESAEKEMGGKTLTLEELDKLLTEQGISTKGRDDVFRIAGDNSTRLIYINDKNEYLKSQAAKSNADSENVSSDTNDTDKPGPSKATVAGSSTDTPIIEDLNEYSLQDEWDSDDELMNNNSITSVSQSTVELETISDDSGSDMNESVGLPSKNFGKNMMNPAWMYMSEHSELTQKQILALIKQNKKENSKITERIRALRQSVSTNMENVDGNENISNSEHSSLSGAKMDIQEIDDVETTQTVPVGNENISRDSTKRKSSESSSESDLQIVESNISSDIQETESNSTVVKSTSPIIKATETSVISGTDTDSDDFIEIQDVPIPDMSNSVNKSRLSVMPIKRTPAKEIQITFNRDDKIEDDLFADVFATTSDTHTTECSQNTNKSETLTPKVDETVSLDVAEKVVEINKPSELRIETNVSENSTNALTIENDLEEGELSEEIVLDSVEGNAEPTSTQETSLDTVTVESKRISPLPVNDEQLKSLKSQLEDQQKELMANIGKLNRQATDISDQIRIEAQELLRLFGIPYIVAPMEAEAQCAYLEQIRLTDGTITDDSDIWLFGGKCVYKNFFNHNKRVLRFQSCDIQHHFKLTRNEMIQFALLVGSDYTMGVTGVGPVTALEILAAFPPNGDNLLHGLINFCSWIKMGKIVGSNTAGLRNKLKNVKIEKGFPSQAVVQAYLFPKVDESKNAFSWGKPNMILLSDYARVKFGWPKAKFDELMAPLLKRFDDNYNQRSIISYFDLETVPKSVEATLSKRVQKAVQKLINNAGREDPVDVQVTEEETKKKKPVTGNKRQKKQNTPINEEISTVSDTGIKGSNVSPTKDKYFEEFIPQREKDRAAALKKKLHAIEVMRKSKQGLYKTKKVKRCVRKVKKEAELSESDSSSS